MIKTSYLTADGEDASDQIEPEQLKTMISYSKYMNECGYHKQIDPNEESLVSKQIKCLEYDGEEILWNGSIELIKVKFIKNTLKTFLNKFIKNIWLKNTILCLIGNGNLLNKNKCNINYLNNYIFEIKMQMGGHNNHLTLLIDDNKFLNVTNSLKSHDHIWFKGTLMYNSNNNYLVPFVNVLEIGCIKCQQFDISNDSEIVYKFSNTFSNFILKWLYDIYIDLEYIVHSKILYYISW